MIVELRVVSPVSMAAGDLPPGDKLVIGLNPPFGKNNMLAEMFVRHAAKFCPRVIVLIVPPGVPVPHGYQVMYEEQETMRDRCCFTTLCTSSFVLVSCSNTCHA